MPVARTIFCGTFVLLLLAGTGAAAFPAFLVSEGPVDQSNASVSGNLVAWVEYRDGHFGVWARELGGGEAFRITDGSADAMGPRVDNGIVFFSDARNGSSDLNLYGYDTRSGTEFPICTAPGRQTYHDLSGDYYVWEDYRNSPTNVPPEYMNADIYGLDLRTGQEFAISTADWSQTRPRISGDIVVWQDARAWWMNDYNIYGYNLRTGEEFQITHDPAPQYAPAISGNYVVWKDSRNDNFDIYGMDLSTGEEFPICLNSSGQGSPAIDGNIVVWADYRNRLLDGRSGQGDIYGYDLLTRTEFLIAGGLDDQYHPQISGNLVVWQQAPQDGGTMQIYGAYVPEPGSFSVLALGLLAILRRPARRPNSTRRA